MTAPTFTTPTFTTPTFTTPTFRGLFHSNKLKKSNSFKHGKSGGGGTTTLAAEEEPEPTTSIFNTLFSSGNQEVGHQQLGDDDGMDASYVH